MGDQNGDRFWGQQKNLGTLGNDRIETHGSIGGGNHG